MKYSKFALTMVFSAASAILSGQTAESNAPKPDNTKVNKRDRNVGEVTADQQKTNSTDQDLTKKIRQSIVADSRPSRSDPQN
jgi:hypothetical protein